MSFVSVLEACAIPLGLFGVLYLMYRSWRREEARKARWERRWRERQARRYRELEFEVAPPLFDQEEAA